MRIPSSVVVLGQRLVVGFPGETNGLDIRHLLGKVDVQMGEIWLDPKQSTDSLKDTLLHEVIHAVLELSKARELAKLEDDEPFVASLASVLFDTLRRNPDLVAWIMEEERHARAGAVTRELEEAGGGGVG